MGNTLRGLCGCFVCGASLDTAWLKGFAEDYQPLGDVGTIVFSLDVCDIHTRSHCLLHTVTLTKSG